MTITIKIDTENAAFHPPDGDRDQEVQNILQKRIDAGWGPRRLLDSNGNHVGDITVRGK